MLLIYYNINELGVGSNMIFLCCILATLLFFCSKYTCAAYFLVVFGAFLSKNRKKSSNFLQFFLSVYQQVRRNLKKKFVKTLDKI